MSGDNFKVGLSEEEQEPELDTGNFSLSNMRIKTPGTAKYFRENATMKDVVSEYLLDIHEENQTLIILKQENQLLKSVLMDKNKTIDALNKIIDAQKQLIDKYGK